MIEISFAGAALAGLLSFFSPCVLPMVPFYLCYMAGLSMSELRGDGAVAPGAQRRLVVSSVFFALGVTTIFTLLGMGATALGQAFAQWRDPLSYVAAAVLALFGLHFLGVIRIPVLYREARLESRRAPATVVGAYVMGLAFGFGWTPCVGPALGLGLFWIGQGSELVFFGSAICVGLGNGLTIANASAGLMSVRPELAGSAAGLSGAMTVALGAALTTVTGIAVQPETAPYAVLGIMLGASLLALISAIYVLIVDLQDPLETAHG